MTVTPPTPNWTLVELRGQYADFPSGAASTGTVTFRPRAKRAVDEAALIVALGRDITVNLDSEGAFTLQLPATDDPDLAPDPFTYEVEEKFGGKTGSKYDIEIPVAAAAAGLDIATIAPKVPTTPVGVTRVQLEQAVQEAKDARDEARQITGIETVEQALEVATADEQSGFRQALDPVLSATFARRYFTDVRVDHGAAADASTEATAAFAAAIATGAKHVNVPAGTYLLNGLTLNKPGQTWHLGPNVTLRSKSGASTQTIFTVTAADVTLEGGSGVVLDGNGQGSSGGSAIYVNNAPRCTINKIKFVNCLGIGINAQADHPVITGCTLVDNGNVAILVRPPTTTADISGVRIEGNKVTNTGNHYGIQVLGRTPAVSRGAKIVNNDVSLPGTAAAGLAIEAWELADQTVIANNTTSGGSMGISTSGSDGCSVVGNTVRGPYSIGIESAACTGTAVAGNTIDGAGITDKGISITNAGGGRCAISGNTVSDMDPASGWAVYLEGTGGKYAAVSGNTLKALVPVLVQNGYGFAVTGNVLIGISGTTSAVAIDNSTHGNSCNNVCEATGAAVNAYGGTKNGIIVGPNVLAGGTTTELINGPLGTGGRIV